MPPTSPASPASPLLRGLNEAQHAAVVSEASPLRILAGAGSGKTRVLTHRIAYRAEVGTLDPNRVLAVTFTRKAAGELRERLGRLGLRSGVHAGTFHSIAYAQLRQRWEERGIRPPELLERKVGFVARLMSSRGGTAPLDVVAEIEWAAARRVGPEQYEAAAALARRRPPLDAGKVAEIYDRVMTETRRRRLVDFDAQLRLAVRDLAADPVYAAARHWRFRHLFVDEFQDVNPLQHALLEAWSGPESDLCAVGDPNQAIYAWNGADSRYLIDFETYFPGSTTVTLEDNYRSTPEILTVANAVLDSGRSVPIRLRPHRPSGPVPSVTDHPDASAEAAAIARKVRDLHSPGTSWSRQAVLVRTNAQATLISEAFTRAAIPHRVRGGGDLLEQPEVRQAVSALRRASSLQMALGDLEEQVRRATPDQDEPDGDAPEGAPAPATAQTTATEAPPTDREMRRSAEEQLTQERAANLAELVRLGREYLAIDPDGGIPGFLGWMTSALRGEDRSAGDAVELVTFHAAKGLEWPIVHLAGLEEGFVPIHHAKESDDDVDEERRLLYVALTRAREELHCTWARSREFGSRSLTRKPSPWLEIVASTVGMAPLQVDRKEGARRARSARSGSSRSGRSAPDELDPANAELFESLRAWRKQKAKEADVPAYVIFNDATLVALATARPSTRAQLLRVSGLGAVKAQRFGDDVLRIVAEAG